MSSKMKHLLAQFAVAACAFQALPAEAQQVDSRGVGVTFADLAGLADSAGLVVRAEVKKMVRVKRERAPGLQAGFGRYYVEARTKALLSGSAPLGESISYLVDLPLDADGDPPVLKKLDVFLFARAVPGRPGELQLVTPTAQQRWSPEREARLRRILTELVAPDAPAEITGVRELLYVPGNLAGQGETQIFLTTKDQSAASITVRHAPGTPPAWGVSFSELMADVGNPPAPETLEWYRLACSLPRGLPADANISQGYAARERAQADYRLVLEALGPCERNL